jgi:hypothetical protein
MTDIGSRWRGALAVACAGLLLGPLAACGESGGDGGSIEPVATSDPVATFAPLVELHGRERWWPISASDFIDYSTFNWSDEPCFNGRTVSIGGPRRRLGLDEPEPITDPRRLGGWRSYRGRPLRRDCERRRPGSYVTTQHTRPYDGPGRAPGLRRGEGFFLDLLTAKLDGDPVFSRTEPRRLRGVPAYVDRRPWRSGGRAGLRIDYWLLYGLDFPRPEAIGDYLEHEGDWEHVTVFVRRAARPGRYVPVSLRLHRDGGSRDLAWSSLELANGASGAGSSHPVLYAARGSHTLYPSPGIREVRRTAWGRSFTVSDETAACPTCVEWRTWELPLPLREQPWHGYGGGWGRADALGDVTSGPLGPF